jgi:homoserine dehydrogenase
MAVIKVAILGFGTVGEGVYQTIRTHGEKLHALLGKRVEVAAVLVKSKQKKRNICCDSLVTTDFADILSLPQLDVVVEAIVGREPTFTFLKKVIQKGCHIITANKEMFAHHGKELLELADENHVSVGFEATVAGGIPIIQTLKQLLKVNQVVQIQGILNGTSNFILTEMREKKQSFEAALRLAQKIGYAEADPTNDLEGFDAFYKTVILSRLAFGKEPNWNDVERKGITEVTSELITTAENLGLRFKHIASVGWEGNQLKSIVKPALVSNNHPFYHVEGVQNAVEIQTNIVGEIMLQGPGAGMYPTASAIIEDLVHVYQSQACNLNALRLSNKLENTNSLHLLWFVHGLIKKQLNQKKLIDQAAEEAFIIKATKNEVEQLVSHHQNVSCFLVLGDYIAKETRGRKIIKIT